MYLLGIFVGQQFDGRRPEDLDFFPFPEINSEHGAGRGRGADRRLHDGQEPKNEDGAKALLEYLGGAEAQNTYLKSDPNNVATNNDADTSGYNALQKKAVELIGGAKHISQFLDRDTARTSPRR